MTKNIGKHVKMPMNVGCCNGCGFRSVTVEISPSKNTDFLIFFNSN